MWFPKVFGARQCDEIINLGRQQPRESGLVFDDARLANEQIRKAGVSWLSAEGDHAWIFEKLAKVVERANRIYQYDLIGFTEDAQFTSYDDRGAFYDWHQDGLEGQLAIRKLSLVLQLSDAQTYRGGNLELFSLSVDRDIQKAWTDDLRQQGSVAVFPAFEYHRVTPITRGERYSLVCWVGGPPFR